MKIGIIGAGYVGLVTACGLAYIGHDVICIDKNEDKIKQINSNKLPIYEKGLEFIYKYSKRDNKIQFSNDFTCCIEKSDIIMICVDTPTNANGVADVSNVYRVVDDIVNIIDSDKIIVVKSTVPIGTTSLIEKKVNSELARLNKDINVTVASNPEFLSQGTAVDCFLNPNRIIVGANDKRTLNTLFDIYKYFEYKCEIISTTPETAEIIKYACNSFLATKISYINMIANVCDVFSSDVTMVSKAMGLDERIGNKFLNPGPGYGGSCFPKDTKAFVTMGENVGVNMDLIKATININKNQKNVTVEKVKRKLKNLKNKNIAVLGVAFKSDTCDLRDSPAIEIIHTLLDSGCKIKVFDPVVEEEKLKSHFNNNENLEYCKEIYECIENTNSILILTEWQEFKSLDINKVKQIANLEGIFDFRNILNPIDVKNCGIYYEGMGVR